MFDNQNQYYVDFKWQPDTKMATFSVEQVESAKRGTKNDLCDKCINKSDSLKKLVIYNADVIGMIDTYTKVTLTKTDQTTMDLMGSATFDIDRKQVWFTVDDSQQVNLPEVSMITIE